MAERLKRYSLKKKKSKTSGGALHSETLRFCGLLSVLAPVTYGREQLRETGQLQWPPHAI